MSTTVTDRADGALDFAAWLTTRDEAVTLSATHDAARIAELVKEWQILDEARIVLAQEAR